MMPSKALAKNVSSTVLALGLIAQATEDTRGEPDHCALASCTRIIHTLMKVFPPFRPDVNQCLWRGGTRLALMPKPFSVLRYLVERAGRLVLQPVRLQMAPTRGYAELMLGEPARAVGYFEEVLDRGADRTFMLWYWRMLARLGLADAHLTSGALAQAGEQAEVVIDDASTLGNSVVHGLACEAAARIAMARGTHERAEELVRRASTIADTPIVAWRAHATAWELSRRLRRPAEAERQRARAESLVLQLAQSFEARHPLRQSLLAAQPVQKILRPPASGTDAAGRKPRRLTI
jgi:hypothetical protein